MPEWKFTMQIPCVDKSHEVIFAFLRTSEWGEWQADTEKASDSFVLNFRRGRKRRDPGLVPNDFALPEHQIIASAMLGLEDAKVPISVVTLANRLDAIEHRRGGWRSKPSNRYASCLATA